MPFNVPSVRAAAALLFKDRIAIAPLVLICSAPSTLGLILNYREPAQKIGIFFVEHLLCIAVSYWIGVKALERRGSIASWRGFLRLQLAGIAFVGVFAAALLVLMTARDLLSALLSLLIFAAVSFGASAYFFYPAILLDPTGWSRAHLRTIASYATSKILPLHALAISYGPSLLLWALLGTASPTGSNTGITILQQIVGGQFGLHGLGWVMLCYIRFGHIASYKDAAADYPQSSLERSLRPVTGYALLGVGILLSLANFFQSFKTPPHESFTVRQASLNGRELAVQMIIEDRQSALFNFVPMRLSLTDSAEARPQLIAPFPLAVQPMGPGDIRFNFPRSKEPQQVTVVFPVLMDPAKVSFPVTLRYRGLPVAQVAGSSPSNQ